MSRLLALLASLWLASLPSAAGAQYPNPGPATQPETPVPGVSTDRPRFSVDGTVLPGTGTPIVRLDYRLARTELLFERRSAGYHAAYEVRAVFYHDKGGRQVTGDNFTRQLAAKTYAETRPVGNDIVDYVELPVPPGRYDVQVVIRDLVAERSAGTQIELEVPSQAAGPLWFGDLSFGTVKRDAPASGDLRGSFVVNPGRRYSDDISLMAIYGEVVDSRPAAANDPGYTVQYRVLNDVQDRIFQKDTTMVRTGGRTPFVLRPGILTLAPGAYRFVVELKAPALPAAPGRRLVPIRREKSFEMIQSAATIAADPRSTLEVLDHISESWERDARRKLKTEDERREFWGSFWKRRDPTPDTPENEAMNEFYRRVQYANQHFGVGGQGWTTDMGRVYIQKGQPDEVVRSPFNFDRDPEEIWYYYRDHQTFVFVDEDGFGRYKLDSTRSR